ncbi:MAG: FecR domain-containing protein [Acidobacteriaceae bacterium]|nr:FecR domain-containing protein [Acidobacteriaceae bacterium]
MGCAWTRLGSLLAGVIGAALCATGQTYTISAKPGAVNYVEGTALLNDQAISETAQKRPFLSAGDTLSTEQGKVEVLLTPGVFLRLGENSMVTAHVLSLTDIQLNLQRGEAMIEVDQLLKDNSIRILTQGASIQILKAGLYRFTVGPPGSAAAINGKAEVLMGEKKAHLGGGHEVVLQAGLSEQKFDSKKEDDLYAWSNARSEYDAAASLQSARSMPVSDADLGMPVAPYAPGWYWNDIFASWAWLPGGDLAFFNSFGYGFFAPGVVAYAPICYVRRPWGGAWHGQTGSAPVAVNPAHPPAVGTVSSSPSSNQIARQTALKSFASGFQTPAGETIPSGNRFVFWSGNSLNSFAGAQHLGNPGPSGHMAGASTAGGHWSRGAASAGHSGGGWSGGSGGGWSGISGGGGMSGGHSGGGGHH